MQLPYASTLAHVLREAEDIGRATGRKASSAHVLLAFFTTRNQAERILRDRRIDEDLLLDQIDPDESEPAETLREIIERAAQVAAGCGTSEVDCLHVLVAMTRVRSSQAYRMLDALDENVNRLRTRALTILTGAVPRWMNAYNKRADEEVEVHSSLPQRARGTAAMAAVFRSPPPSRSAAYPPRAVEKAAAGRAAICWGGPKRCAGTRRC